MKRFVWQWLVVSSALLSSGSLAGETRPQYGGTVHMATRTVLTSLDPADRTQPDSFARRSLTMLMFDTLTTMDESGHVLGALAVSWQAGSGSQQWQFRLRPGVKFHDGTPLTAEIAAASLRFANPSWNVSTQGDAVVIEGERSDAELLAELALPRNAIVKRSADAKPDGTGPFHVVDWQPGKKLTLAAEEHCWSGRPYLDGIEIELNKSYRDQMTALDLGKADFIEIPAEQVHRASLEAHGVGSSAAIELVALLFSRDAKSPEDKWLREALAFSVERGSIRSVLLQGAGQPAGGILPNWMSGYGFVFPVEADLSRARHAREQVRPVPTWTLGYDGNDSVTRLLAERIALNAKDAGLSLQPTAAAAADVRLVRIPLASMDPWVSLADFSAMMGLPAAKAKSASVEDLYAAEESLLTSQRIIPLLHVPASYSAGNTLRNWRLRADGSWNLADAWLGSKQP